MTDTQSVSPNDEPKYRIGAVCRLTGLSPHVLRVWEKRYAVVKPERSESRRRLYSNRDVNRLFLLKTLVDRGQAIGSIAGLETAELEQRLSEFAGPLPLATNYEKPGLALIGRSLSVALEACASNKLFNLVGHFADLSGFEQRKTTTRVDLLVIEWPNLHPENAIEITRLANRLDVRHVILVYDYSSRVAMKRVNNDRISPLRAPLDMVALEAVVACRFGGAGRSDDLVSGPAPPRIYADRELSWLAAQSSSIACECPMHLAQLITRLLSFEHYSAECESLNAEDAALHGYLHKTTARARQLMEQALVRVVELENLSPEADT
jgi:DNA-binding transcriptional MerR regulator